VDRHPRAGVRRQSPGHHPAILKYNAEAIEILRHIAEGQFVRLPPATSRGRAALNAKEQVTVPVRIHYMIGNHEWYYHIPGQTFDRIRQGIILALGLVNPNSPLPHEVKESETLQRLFAS